MFSIAVPFSYLLLPAKLQIRIEGDEKGERRDEEGVGKEAGVRSFSVYMK
jgi:hypothetical protein